MVIPDGFSMNTNTNIQSNNLSREDTVNQAIHAIAAEDAGFSRILDAQSERLRYIIGILPGQSGREPALERAILASDSVRRTIQIITNMQMISNQKLSELLEDGSGQL